MFEDAAVTTFVEALYQEEKVNRINNALRYKYAPFIRKKSVVPKRQNLKNEVVENYHFMDG
ncbi:MAG: hypothetical protein WCK78_05040 [Paludibacter sp.]